MIGVSIETLKNHGAVSSKVAAEMAEGALQASQSDIAISVTGIAGPTGGSDMKPVGTVWIGVATKDKKTRSIKCFYPQDRSTFKSRVSQKALTEAWKELK